MAKKICDNCKKEVGVRTLKCECGFDFSTKVKSEKVAKVYSQEDLKDNKSAMRGKKVCPTCNSILGARTHVCNCGYEFPKVIVKEESEKSVDTTSILTSEINKVEVVKTEEEIEEEILKEQEISDEVKALTHKQSSIKEAKRILNMGKVRATSLLSQSRGVWGHVDWNYVEEGIKNLEE